MGRVKEPWVILKVEVTKVERQFGLEACGQGSSPPESVRLALEELGRNARGAYESHYTTELMIDRLEAYYRSVRAARPPQAVRLSA